MLIAVNIPSLIKSTPCDYNDILVPEWYNGDSVHEVEKLALPEFFKENNNQGQFTPENYKMCRDYMINTYRSNPEYCLTVSACKAKLDVDLVTLVRIHSFLEVNQLINSRVRSCRIQSYG